MPKKISYARLDAFAKGQIWGMHLAGASREDIKKATQKTDGRAPTYRTIDSVIAEQKANPEWRGEAREKGGRPQKLDAKLKKQLVDLVFKFRGKAKVTLPFCRQTLPELRTVSRFTVSRALHEAGLAWLTRRSKAHLPPEKRQARLKYCAWLKRKHSSTLQRWAYTDGTTFYLARGPCDEEQQSRARLGRRVWRMSSGKDGLHDDNVSAALYSKAQGLPVKMWGFFANGRLEYEILPADSEKGGTTHMTSERYADMVDRRFADWRRACFGDGLPCHLVQDHERALWTEAAQRNLQDAGCLLVTKFPKSSPDLNAIEGWWSRLRQRLEDTAPVKFEKRAAFLVRLRRTVTWMNRNWAEEAKRLCTNQKVRGQAVEDLDGARSSW